MAGNCSMTRAQQEETQENSFLQKILMDTSKDSFDDQVSARACMHDFNNNLS